MTIGTNRDRNDPGTRERCDGQEKRESQCP